MLLEQRKKDRPGDDEARGVLERDGARGTGPPVVGGHGAERIAGAEDLEDQVLAARHHLEDLHAARGDRIERVGWRALLEDRLPFAVPLDGRGLRDRPAIFGSELAEAGR